jgi:hypothetical protein
MLIAEFLLPLYLATAGTACPNLSGGYVIQGEDGQVYVGIAQTRCEHMTVTWESSMTIHRAVIRHFLTLDGRPHADGPWFGERVGGLTSAALLGDTLDIVMHVPTMKHANGAPYAMRLVVLSSGDLCVMGHSGSARSASSMRAAKQRTLDQRGINEAARRSETSCSVK